MHIKFAKSSNFLFPLLSLITLISFQVWVGESAIPLWKSVVYNNCLHWSSTSSNWSSDTKDGKWCANIPPSSLMIAWWTMPLKGWQLIAKLELHHFWKKTSFLFWLHNLTRSYDNRFWNVVLGYLVMIKLDSKIPNSLEKSQGVATLLVTKTHKSTLCGLPLTQ